MASLAGLAFVDVLAGSTQAALANPTDREAAIVTPLITASGISVFDIGAPVWGLLIGARCLSDLREKPRWLISVTAV